MLGGIVIAYFVIQNDEDNTPDFVNDIAGGVEAPNILGIVASLLPIMAFVIGASYYGADAKSGMIEQILTWEPRRLRLLAARTLSSLVGVGVIGALMAAYFVALLYGLAATTGTTGGTTGELWANIGLGVLRTGVAVGLFAIFGLGITVLINNSVGSIVGFIIYWFILENFIIAVFLPKVSVYLPITNAGSFGSGNDVERITGNAFSQDGPDLVVSHGYLLAGAILAAWVVTGLALAAVAFMRRDID
jgi:ABC-type transport system involved in multi-copper enzyme maturation permease subunit